MPDRDLLRRAAECARDRRSYLASSLLPYAQSEGLDDARLAERPGCDPASLPALLLCGQPTREAGVFRADIEAIAERFGLNGAHLAHILRHADTLVAFKREAPSQARGGLLAAARDRDDDDRQPSDDRVEPPPPASRPDHPKP